MSPSHQETTEGNATNEAGMGPASMTAVEDTEKGDSSQLEQSDIDLDHVGETQGYVLNAQAGHASTRHLKTTKDGSTILIPQPSNDPNDPLNWSQTKKNIILAVISFTGEILPLYRLHNP